MIKVWTSHGMELHDLTKARELKEALSHIPDEAVLSLMIYKADPQDQMDHDWVEMRWRE